MTRKYMNDRWCVRCGKTSPTPYLSKYIHLFEGKGSIAVDIGCGNGRNSKFLQEHGFKVTPIDMAPPCDGQKLMLGHDKFDVPDYSVDVILANYILMFLNEEELDQVMGEVNRIAGNGCYLVIELYPAKDSHYPDMDSIMALHETIASKYLTAWGKVRRSKDKSIWFKPV